MLFLVVSLLIYALEVQGAPNFKHSGSIASTGSGVQIKASELKLEEKFLLNELALYQEAEKIMWHFAPPALRDDPNFTGPGLVDVSAAYSVIEQSFFDEPQYMNTKVFLENSFAEQLKLMKPELRLQLLGIFSRFAEHLLFVRQHMEETELLFEDRNGILRDFFELRDDAPMSADQALARHDRVKQLFKSKIEQAEKLTGRARRLELSRIYKACLYEFYAFWPAFKGAGTKEALEKIQAENREIAKTLEAKLEISIFGTWRRYALDEL